MTETFKSLTSINTNFIKNIQPIMNEEMVKNIENIITTSNRYRNILQPINKQTKELKKFMENAENFKKEYQEKCGHLKTLFNNDLTFNLIDAKDEQPAEEIIKSPYKNKENDILSVVNESENILFYYEDITNILKYIYNKIKAPIIKIIVGVTISIITSIIIYLFKDWFIFLLSK